ncbi:chorismate mutase [Sandaracinus amylolyticus]|uniref:chorismate mutase n=1 Tax=Sandaracinus amylolyticus TaxID=927083 RepID=UPI00069F8583|nr:chorismate mutase [Sandaracinus amylolyticus]
MSTESLEELRRRVDDADRALLEALAARRRVVLAIAEVKRRSGIAVVQPNRFLALVDDRIATGLSLGLSPVLVRALFERIHEQAIADQLGVARIEETLSK